MGSQQFGEARLIVKPSARRVGVAPLEVVAVEFPGYRFRGEVLAALNAAADCGAIRIIVRNKRAMRASRLNRARRSSAVN
jgi:hypothetical protein